MKYMVIAIVLVALVGLTGLGMIAAGDTETPIAEVCIGIDNGPDVPLPAEECR